MDSQLLPQDGNVPPGFVRMEPYGGFHELVGPLYESLRDGRTVVGVRIGEKHLNRGKILHGGMVFMLLDTAMTHACVRVCPLDAFVVTTTFSSELFAAAQLGDWIEAEVEVNRAVRRVIFLNCLIRRGGAGGEPLVRGSASFQVVARAT